MRAPVYYSYIAHTNEYGTKRCGAFFELDTPMLDHGLYRSDEIRHLFDRGGNAKVEDSWGKGESKIVSGWQSGKRADS